MPVLFFAIFSKNDNDFPWFLVYILKKQKGFDCCVLVSSREQLFWLWFDGKSILFDDVGICFITWFAWWYH